MVLYTDGLVEGRGTALTDSMDELRSSLQHLSHGTSADELCEALLVAKALDQTRDDIAIVVTGIFPANMPEGDSVGRTMLLTTSAQSEVSEPAL